MSKHRGRRIPTIFKALSPWYFFVLAVIATVVCITALRHNYEHMTEFREAVFTADKNGTDVQKPLKDLQAYVTSHMNTNLTGDNGVYPPIQLKYTYDRLVQAHSAQLAQANSQLYTEAQHYCEQQNSRDFSGRNRVPCIEQYVGSHGGQAPAPIPDALYKFSFVTPKWSPDLAGWSMVVAILSWLGFLLMLIGRKLARKLQR